jgi:hypothetical protein
MSTTELCGAMASLLWQEAPNATVETFSDILIVQLQWSYGAKKEPWQIEERVALGELLGSLERDDTNL